jgi:diguanylate cyclase (GGDEF)-like protein/PAS domain S-box-containing protein
MSQPETIRLLIIHDDATEVDRLLSMLRNSGKSTRAQHVPSIEGFEKLLADHAWDLLLALDSSTTCDPKSALRIIKKLDKDIPAIFLTESIMEEFNIALIDSLKAGARDVVILDDDQHLVMTINREIQNLQERRERRIADRKLKESESRCQQLLDHSKDAIAYVEDGLFLYANQSFAEKFGYQEQDEILAIPVIDVIAASDHQNYKTFMKSFKLSQEIGATELELKGTRSDKSEFGMLVQVSHATFENDPCTQLRVAAKLGLNSAEVEAEIKKAAALDPLTGVYNRVYTGNAINNAIKDACENDKYRSLHILSIDLYEDIRTTVGLTGRDGAVSDMANFIKSLLPSNAFFGRIADDEFALLIDGIDEEQQIKLGKSLCESVASHICQAGDKTLQLTLSMGICPITEKTTSADQVFERAHIACNEVRANGKNGVGNASKFYVPKLADAGQEQNDNLMSEIIGMAIEKEELELKFQPMISLRGESTEYYEACVSMPPDKSGKSITADEIISITNRDDNISKKLDKWNIITSLKKLAENRKDGKKTQIFINLTQASIKDSGFPDWLVSAYKAANLPADSLILQFSESDATSYLTHAKSFVDAINQMGGKCCVRNFGCSLDPFKTLTHINVDIVKADESFSTDIQKKNESPDTLKDLLTRINEAGKQSIVPQVENATLLATLWQAGAHYIQGNYVQPPSDKMEFVFSEE